MRLRARCRALAEKRTPTADSAWHAAPKRIRRMSSCSTRCARARRARGAPYPLFVQILRELDYQRQGDTIICISDRKSDIALSFQRVRPSTPRAWMPRSCVNLVAPARSRIRCIRVPSIACRGECSRARTVLAACTHARTRLNAFALGTGGGRQRAGRKDSRGATKHRAHRRSGAAG